MKTVFRLAATLAVSSLALLLSREVQAENCWMVGCVGRIGYVFLPVPIYPLNGQVHYSLNGHDCKEPMPAESRPFGTVGLPDVNSVVAIADNRTLLLTENQIEAHLGSFQGVSFERTDDGSGCQAVWRQPVDVDGDPMKAGAKVKILGYRTFVTQASRTGVKGVATSHEQILFALVMVESDL